ncbi:pilus assembly PilX family protein [Agarivorans sp. QJM3NY_25]|uniref:pilus assembly PilX family protein n=1 Tax=Agarivorans sp. QJM3NY_25 TaxID=3421430 RepID=UPI003D7D391E
MPQFQRQYGMALIMSLIMVLIIAMIGVSITQQVSSGRKNSAIYQDHTVSYARANSGIWEAEQMVKEQAYSVDALLKPTTANSLVAAKFGSADWWQTNSNWDTAHKMVVVKDANGQALAGEPRYIIEDAGVDSGLVLGVNIPKRRFLRITARAQGEGGAVTYLQSYVAFME